MKFDRAPVIRPIFFGPTCDRTNGVPLYKIKIIFPWVTPLELFKVATQAVFTRFCPPCLSFMTISYSEENVANCGKALKDLNDESDSYLHCLF